MTMGPIIPMTELKLMPRPRTTVGYNSDAANGSTTNADEMPILPTQYKANMIVGSCCTRNVAKQATPPIIIDAHKIHLRPKKCRPGHRKMYVGSSTAPARKKFQISSPPKHSSQYN